MNRKLVILTLLLLFSFNVLPVLSFSAMAEDKNKEGMPPKSLRETNSLRKRVGKGHRCSNALQ